MRIKTRIWSIIGLTLVLGGTIAFLVQTSTNVQWGGGFWENWLTKHLQLQPAVAHQIVFWFRKTTHFLGYGSFTLLLWLYFHLWGLRKSAAFGLIGAALVAAFDEYTQSLSSFRSGMPTDVVLDICGGIVFTLVTAWRLKQRRKHLTGSF